MDEKLSRERIAQNRCAELEAEIKNLRFDLECVARMKDQKCLRLKAELDFANEKIRDLSRLITDMNIAGGICKSGLIKITFRDRMLAFFRLLHSREA